MVRGLRASENFHPEKIGNLVHKTIILLLPDSNFGTMKRKAIILYSYTLIQLGSTLELSYFLNYSHNKIAVDMLTKETSVQVCRIYRTSVIITCILYISYPIFQCGLLSRAVNITDNLCTKQGNVGLNSMVYNQERVIMGPVRYNRIVL